MIIFKEKLTIKSIQHEEYSNAHYHLNSHSHLSGRNKIIFELTGLHSEITLNVYNFDKIFYNSMIDCYDKKMNNKNNDLFLNICYGEEWII
jgi:hypothetical protein